MTTKDKAKELVDKFIEHTEEWNEIDGYVIDKYRAKQCALIAVDEILIAVESDWGFMQVRKEYWQEVKQEIEKL